MSLKQRDYAIPSGYDIPDIHPPHQFDPDASPQAKKQQALQAAKNDTLPPLSLDNLPNASLPAAIKAVLDPSKLDPSVSTQEIRSAALSDSDLHDSSQPTLASADDDGPFTRAMPGTIDSPAGARRIPDWYRVGWAAQIERAGQIQSQSGEDGEADEMKHLDLLETFIGEMYYGSWFHNAAIIFFAVAASHYATVFGGGWSSLIVILTICTTYYQTSIRRHRRNARGDISRELAKQRLFQDHETADWLNNFFHRFWLIYEPVLSATIVASVDQILIASTPSFLESIRMSTFTLGSKAPRIEFVRSHPETEDDVVVMDWKFDFTPNDILDMTAKAAASKINPKIVLTIRIGKGVIGAAKDIVVEDLTFCGTIRVRIKLMNNFPHLQLVDLSFLERPEFDFVLKPVGFDLNMIPGLSGFIESQVHASLGPMMYDPNVFTLNLEQMLAGTPVDTAVGVLQVTLTHARGLKAMKMGGGTPDPYVTFSVGARLNLDRSKVKRSTQNPHWNSVHFILLHSLNEILTLEIMDYNEVRKDTSLGVANVDLQTLASEPEQDGVTVPILYQAKPRGEVRLSLCYHPCLMAKKLENGQEEPVPETTAGVVRLMVHQAKELDYKRPGTSSLSTYVKVYVNGLQIHKTVVVKRTNNPVWETFVESLVSNKASATVMVKVFDARSVEDALVGSVSTKLTDLLELTGGEQKLDWFPLAQAKSGKLRLSASWKGIIMAGAINGASVYTPPIGVLKFYFERAEDLKNVEALTGGKSDPYVRVMRSGIILARSQIHNNTLDPDFDEIIYVPVHSMKDLFRIELMDYQHLTKDRSLGVLEVEAKRLIESFKTDEGIASYRSTGKQEYFEFLKQEGKKAVVKGRLKFEVEFYGCRPVKFRPFEVAGSDVEKMKADDASDCASTVDARFDDGASMMRALPKTPVEVSAMLAPPLPDGPMAGAGAGAGAGAEATGGMKSEDEGGRASGDTRQSTGQESRNGGLKELKKEELLGCQSGVLVFNIMGGRIAKKNARLEFLFDDGYWPTYSTEPSKSIEAKWDETGECFIRELDWSRCILKLNVADRDTREEVYAEYCCGLRAFLEDCLDGPHEFILEDLEGGNRSSVFIQCRYIPVPITLESRESINNMGILSVMLDFGKDLPAADRNGYSDPFAQFILNGQKVYKSGVQKKTLNPKWNERFEIEVPSRVHAEFYVHIYDWDRVGASDKLGQGQIDLKELEPMQMSTVVVKLSQGDKEHGLVQLRLTFRPSFITRSRQATSTFTGLGRVATGLGGSVLSTGAGVGLGAAKGVGQVGGGVIKGVGGVGKLGYAGIRRVTGLQKRESVVAEDPESTVGEAGIRTPPPPLQFPAFTGGPVEAAGSPGTSPAAAAPVGEYKLHIAILGASELENVDGRVYVHVRKNGKGVYDTKVIRHSGEPEWNEVCGMEVKRLLENTIELVVYEKKKLGKDREIGQVVVKVWEVLEPEAGRSVVEIEEPFEQGVGRLRTRMTVSEIAGVTTGVSRRSISMGSPFGMVSSGGVNQASGIAPFLEHDPTVVPGSGVSGAAPGKAGSIIGGRSIKSGVAGRFSIHRNR